MDLNNIVGFKAVDKNGNERQVTLQCDEKQLKTLLAITEAVLSVDDTRTDNSDI